MTTDPIVKLIQGERELDISTGRYRPEIEFAPPSTLTTPHIATGTSANRSGSPPLRTPQAVLDALGNEVELVIDSGETSYDKPSTVVDFMVSPPAIIRKGAIPSEKIMEILDGA